MTNHQEEISCEQAALRRFASIVAGSAELAERAAWRSLAVRCFVLLVLRWSEYVARRYLLDVCAKYGLAAPTAALIQSFHLDFGTRDDARRLAQNLRALAAEFEALAACPDLIEHPFWRAMYKLERLSQPPLAYRGVSAERAALSVVRVCVAANSNRALAFCSGAPNLITRSGRLLRAFPAPS